MTKAGFPSRQPEGGRGAVGLPSRFLGRILDVMRHKFGDPRNIFRAELKDLVWKPDKETSMLFVVPGFEAAPGSDEANVLPRVVVNLGEYRKIPGLSPIVDDDGITLGGGSDDGYLGRTRHHASFQGSATITAASRSGMEALAIAEDVLLTMLTLKAEIRDSMCLEYLDVASLQGPSKNEGPPSCFIAGVQLGWAASVVWDIVPDGLPLADISHPATN